MPMDFVFQSRPARVVFGADSLRHLERELLELGLERALILCTPEQRWLAESIAAELGGRAAGIFDGAVMHVPAAVVDNARQYARSVRADGMIAAGGGSTIGLAKALALDSGMPIIAVPTTYAGSEMTPIFGITQGRLKRTGTDPRVLPRVVIYDPRLTLTLPVDISIASGLNALAHAAEGLYARDANPVTSLMAEEAIAALARGIPAIFRDGDNADGRDDMLYGCWLAGSVLGNVGMALHHKLCHTLGGTFNLPHAQTHAIVLPHALAYNAAAAPQAMRRIARALGTDSAALGVYELARRHGAPLALSGLGLRAADLDRAAEIACANPYWNPRPIELHAIRSLLQDAFAGNPPATA
jgi:maleylacetate reductase